MCGISGFNWKNRRMVNRMNERLKHRGPDGRGVYADRKVTLGSTRLAIVDRSEKGSQPMTYGHKGREAVIIYNGEIYNFNDIRQALMEKGHVFVSDTDTEVVVASYAEWGPDCVKKFNGMWAFAIYDKEKGTLFLSRDRLGQKPLYYYFDKERFIFSSELKGIMEHPLDLKMNAEAVDLFLHFGFIPSPYSVFDRIFKLEPRQNIIFDLKRITIKKYYYYTAPSVNPSYDKKRLFNETDALLRDAIGLRLPSEVPFGVFLSGGLDSSYIVSTIVRHKLVDVLHTFSLEVEGRRNETKDIISFGGESRISRHTYSLAEKNAEQLLEQYTRVFDEPYALSGPFPRLWLSQLAKSRISVALTGEGGDELFAGYPKHRTMYRMAMVRKFVPRWLLKIACVVMLKIKKTTASHRIAGMLLAKDDLNLCMEFYRSGYYPWAVRKYLKKRIRQVYEGANDPAETVLRMDMLYLTNADNLLQGLDKASMAHSLEARCPFLDYRFIDLAAKVPMRYKFSLLRTKSFLRDLLRERLPKTVTAMRKQGFVFDTNLLLASKKYGEKLRKNFDKLIGAGILNERQRELYMAVSSDVAKGRNDNAMLAYYWRFIVLQLWHERWCAGHKLRRRAVRKPASEPNNRMSLGVIVQTVKV